MRSLFLSIQALVIIFNLRAPKARVIFRENANNSLWVIGTSKGLKKSKWIFLKFEEIRWKFQRLSGNQLIYCILSRKWKQVLFGFIEPSEGLIAARRRRWKVRMRIQKRSARLKILGINYFLFFQQIQKTLALVFRAIGSWKMTKLDILWSCSHFTEYFGEY